MLPRLPIMAQKLWHCDPLTGQNAIWLMNGITPVVQTLIPSGDTNFSVQKTGDFNGDRKSDIFFRDPYNWAKWYMVNGWHYSFTIEFHCFGCC